MATVIPNITSRDNSSTKVPEFIHPESRRTLLDALVQFHGHTAVRNGLNNLLEGLLKLKAQGVKTLPETALTIQAQSSSTLGMAAKLGCYRHFFESYANGQDISQNWRDTWDNKTPKNARDAMLAMAESGWSMVECYHNAGDPDIEFTVEHVASKKRFQVCCGGILELCEYVKKWSQEPGSNFFITAEQTQAALGKTYEVPVSDELTADEPPENIFDDVPDNTLEQDLQSFKTDLDADRDARRALKAEGKNKAMMSPDNSPYGTYTKFERQFRRVKVENPPRVDIVNRVVLLGVGKNGTTGMATAAFNVFDAHQDKVDYEFVLWDPDLQPEMFPTGKNVVPNAAAFDVNNDEHVASLYGSYLVASDAAVGERDSFCSTHTSIIRQCITELFDSGAIGNMSAKFDLYSELPPGHVYMYGRGHNSEGFVLAFDGGGELRYPTRETISATLQAKRKCSKIRNALLLYPHLRFERVGVVPDMVPVAPYSGTKPVHFKAVNYRTKRVLTAGEFVSLIGEYGKDITPGSPLMMVINQVMLLASYAPQFDISTIIPRTDRLVTAVIRNTRLSRKNERRHGTNINAHSRKGAIAVRDISRWTAAHEITTDPSKIINDARANRTAYFKRDGPVPRSKVASQRTSRSVARTITGHPELEMTLLSAEQTIEEGEVPSWDCEDDDWDI